jgi:hypothetical protein
VASSMSTNWSRDAESTVSVPFTMTAEEREAAGQDGATRRSRSLAYPSPPETSLTALC